MTWGRMDREGLLRQLVRRTRPIDVVLANLRDVGWDSEREYAVIGPDDVLEVLDAFDAGAMSAEAVERWAEALEMREDLEMTEPVREALFRLANPVLGYTLSPDVVRSIRRLVVGTEQEEN